MPHSAPSPSLVNRACAIATMTVLLVLVAATAANAAGRPQAPQKLRANASGGSITLTWRIAGGGPAIKRVRIYRRSGTRWPRRPIATVSATSRSFIDRGLRNGRSYVYRLRAVARSGRYSRQSRTVRAKPRKLIRPRPPIGLRAGARDGSITLTWRIAGGGPAIKRVRIYRRSGTRWPRRPIATVSATSRSFIDRGLRNGRSYVYRLRAVARSGRYSRQSRTVRAKPRRGAGSRPVTAPLGGPPSSTGAPGPPQANAGGIAPDPGPGGGAPPTGGGAPPGTAGCTLYGPYHAGNRPPACWKPYAATSPFNRPIPSTPRVHPNSSAIVSRLLSWGDPQTMLAGHSTTNDDYFHPLYYSRAGDPLFTVKCAVAASGCKVNGDQVRIPDAARAAGGGDGHLAVIDQATGWEYDFWQVRSKPAGGGTLTVSHGGKTRIDGDGLGSNATAAWFGLAAGIIRGPEMQAGTIDHALFAAIKCTAGVSVYPAQPGTTANRCSDFGLSNTNAPPLGARLQLAMSDAEINALAIPEYRKIILRALARYGLIVGDTNGGNAAWGIQVESGAATPASETPTPSSRSPRTQASHHSTACTASTSQPASTGHASASSTPASPTTPAEPQHARERG